MIGTGTMGTLLAEQIIKKEVCYSSDIVVTGHRQENVELLRRLGANVEESSAKAAKTAEVVLICTKQLDALTLLKEVGSYLRGKTVISIAAEVSCSAIESLAIGAEVVRAMPVRSTRSFTALSAGSKASWDSRTIAENIFRSIGEVTWKREEKLTGHTVYVACMEGLMADIGNSFASTGEKNGWTKRETEVAIAWSMRALAHEILDNEATFADVTGGVATKAGMTGAARSKGAEMGLGNIISAMTDSMFGRAGELANMVADSLKKNPG